MATHETAELVTFVAQTETEAFGRKFAEGDSVEVLLGQNWNEDEGLGEGGPWGFGGYTTETLETIGERIWEGGKGQEVFCKSDN